MTIFINGDSNMAGTELRFKQRGIAPVLSNLLGFDHQVNYSLAGCGNDRIYDTTIDYLKNHSPEFVVIGWTESSRLQWLIDNETHYRWIEVNRLGVGEFDIPEKFQNRYKLWQQNIRYDGSFHRNMRMYWHEKIFNLHTLLEFKKIPHLFFNAFHAFQYQEEFYLDWNNNYFFPYDDSMSYVQWCSDRGHQEITPGKSHYNETAQTAWAETLYQHIKQHNII